MVQHLTDACQLAMQVNEGSLCVSVYPQKYKALELLHGLPRTKQVLTYLPLAVQQSCLLRRNGLLFVEQQGSAIQQEVWHLLVMLF
jgi:hypothetical protein